jgi:hypothetical protein
LHFSILNFVPEGFYVPFIFPKWFSNYLKHIVFSKKRAHAKFKTSHCPLDYAECSTLELLTRLSLENAILPSCLILSLC